MEAQAKKLAMPQFEKHGVQKFSDDAGGHVITQPVVVGADYAYGGNAKMADGKIGEAFAYFRVFKDGDKRELTLLYLLVAGKPRINVNE